MMTLDATDLNYPLALETVPEYVTSTLPLIPAHLQKRFHDIVKAFTDKQDKFGLANGSFRYGPTEVNLVVLFKWSHLEVYPGDPFSNFDVDTSLVYIW